MESIKFKFGNFKLSNEVGKEYYWSGCNVKSSNEKMKFEEQIPVSVITKQKIIEPFLLGHIEKVLSNLDFFIETAIFFLKKTLQENPITYNIKGSELPELELDIYNFPVDQPEIIFYEDNEWMIRFATGRFEICDPYGIAVSFKDENPVSVEDLSDSEIVE